MKALQNFLGFITGVREELRQVTWPSREELLGSALVVFVGAGLLAIYIGIVDFALSGAVRLLLR